MDDKKEAICGIIHIIKIIITQLEAERLLTSAESLLYQERLIEYERILCR